jgi:hypothetical protein
MEGAPTGEFFDRVVESIDEEVEAKHFIMTRLNGLKLALEGFRYPLPPNAKVADRRERDDILNLWRQDAISFFNDVQQTPFRSVLRLGNQLVRGHGLRPIGADRALFDANVLLPQTLYVIDYVGEHRVPQGCNYDLPAGSLNSDQVYIGDISRQVAISLVQLQGTLIADGDLWLEPKSNYPS